MKKLESNEVYHANEAVGSSTLKSIAKSSVLHAINQEFKATDSLLIGSAAHAAILEPETFDSQFAVAPKVDKRTKLGKETWNLFMEEAGDKQLLNEDQMAIVEGIKAATMSHPIARGMLTGGEAEYSYYSKCPETGLELKCRPDYVNQGALIDLKTTLDASLEGFTRQAGNLYYHLQAAYYLDVYNAANGTNVNEFFFVAVENKAPFGVSIWKVGHVEIEAGRAEYKAALRKYAKYMNDKSVNESFNIQSHGYPQEIKELVLPLYVLNRSEIA